MITVTAGKGLVVGSPVADGSGLSNSVSTVEVSPVAVDWTVVGVWTGSVNVGFTRSSLVAEGTTSAARVTVGAGLVAVGREIPAAVGLLEPEEPEDDWPDEVGFEPPDIEVAGRLCVAVLVGGGAPVVSVGIGVPAPWVGTPVLVGPGTFCTTWICPEAGEVGIFVPSRRAS